MIMIDGLYGEGGGQVLRTSLGLSMYTGKAFSIDNIRGKRRKPGLLRQHLTAVRAAAEISGAKIEGASVKSQHLSFIPGKCRGGEYHFSVGTAGSATLVLQAVLPALITADGRSELVIEGGTHNPYAPPYDFLTKAFLPLLNKMGCRIETEIEMYGFYPAGGGRFKVVIEPASELSSLVLLERGEITNRHVQALLSMVPRKIADCELAAVLQSLSWPQQCGVIEDVESPGPGNTVSAVLESANLTEVFTGFGEMQVPANKVASNVVKQVQRYLASEAPVGRFLADQLLVPMAIAGEGRFRTLAPSMHTQTNIAIIKQFLDVEIECREFGRDLWEIEVSGGK